MRFTDYSAAAGSTAIYPGAGTGSAEALAYLALGLNGEAGEVADKIKKALRDGADPDDLAEAVELELGDVLWYVDRFAAEIRSSLGIVAERNLGKLSSRQQRGVLGGSGDDR